ncbi:hypothetical protein BDW62DRAFT_190142 [Aspergillus aurantiobrunneus]
MGNPPLGAGTATDSINWVGYLTTKYNDTTVLSYNHAVYGATVNNSVVANVPQDLVHQVTHSFDSHYCPYGLPDALDTEANSEDALFILWVGINDIYFACEHPDPLADLTLALQTYVHLIDHLHDCGARDILVLNTPPIHRTPKILALEPSTALLYEIVVQHFNNQLQDAVTEWGSAHSDSRISVYDTWSLFTELLDHPREYGFLDATCIGEGCVWWNSFHPMSALHRLLAADVARYLGWLG